MSQDQQDHTQTYGQVPWNYPDQAGQQQTGAYGPRYMPPPMPPTSQPPKRKRRIWPWVLVLVAVALVLVGVAASSGGNGPELRQAVPTVDATAIPVSPGDGGVQETTPPPPNLGTQDPAKNPVTEPALTTAQKQAAGAAQDYLNIMGFSQTGLIQQLEFDGFSRADASKAIGSLHVDWNAQAVKVAKNYLQIQHFSRSALIAQLKFDGFTQNQAEWGVSKAGL